MLSNSDYRMLHAIVIYTCITILLGCTCSSEKPADSFCKDDSNPIIIQVLIDEITHRTSGLTSQPQFGSTSVPHHYEKLIPQYLDEGVTEASGQVTAVYKGHVTIGDKVYLQSYNMDSMCGIGNSLHPGRRFILSTQSINATFSVSLCYDFFFEVGGWHWRSGLERILKGVDCTCRTSRCKFREPGSRNVFRGNCASKFSYCARDEQGTCRWNNVKYLECCRYGYCQQWRSQGLCRPSRLFASYPKIFFDDLFLEPLYFLLIHGSFVTPI